MWLTFAGAVLISLLVLYLPGYFVGRLFSIGRFASLAIAPMLSGLAFVVIGLVFSFANIACSGVCLFIIVSALCGIAWQTAQLIQRQKRNSKRSLSNIVVFDGAKETVAISGAYIGVSLTTASIVFLATIGDPNAFGRFDDTTMHMSVVRGFVETGTYSTLRVSAFIDHNLSGIFYPAEFHILASVVASFFGNNVSMAINAVLFALLAFVFPLAMCLLICKLFPDKPVFRYSGALFVLAFCGFPWGFIVFGQLLSNMMAFMFIPMVLTLFLETTSCGQKRVIVRLVFLSFLGLLSIAFAQPNGAFTLGIWVVACGVSRFFYEPGSKTARFSPRRILGASLLAIGACFLWAAMFYAPFMQTILKVNWPSIYGREEAVVHGLLLMFTEREGIQPFLSVMTFAGVLYTCKNRRLLWLSVACLFAFFIYAIDASTNGFLKHILSGFWYTDQYRTGAMAALFAIPLASIGFAWLLNGLQQMLSHFASDPQGNGSDMEKPALSTIWVPSILLIALMALSQFLPFRYEYAEGKAVTLGYQKTRDVLAGSYSWENSLTLEERAFAEQAMREIGEGSLIINVPHDGSGWLYGLTGADTYFRRSSLVGMGNYDESKVLRTKLCNAATDIEVQKLLGDFNARYLIMFDIPTSVQPTYYNLNYKPEDWVGIESIDENTPGFTLILSNGDMRLYRIDAIE